MAVTRVSREVGTGSDEIARGVGDVLGTGGHDHGAGLPRRLGEVRVSERLAEEMAADFVATTIRSLARRGQVVIRGAY